MCPSRLPAVGDVDHQARSRIGARQAEHPDGRRARTPSPIWVCPSNAPSKTLPERREPATLMAWVASAGR
jgi:hypothetical protein